MAGSVTIQGLLTGTTSGTQYVGPFVLVPNAAGNYATTEVTLASGANTITVPSWAAFAIIIPPTANAVALTLKGVTGDTGILIDLTSPSLLNFPATPPASFVITAASLTTAPTTIVFT
jgi:hypothetical protein